MSFPKYNRYKESGVEWLGEVPEHWNIDRLKHNLRLLTEKTDRRENPVALENIQSWTGCFVPTETEFEGEGVAFECGDILFGKLRPYLAKAYLAESLGEAVGDFHVMRPSNILLGQYSIYQILNREFIAIVDSSTFGAKMPRVSWEFMANIAMLIPPLPEQQSIATFLDRETAKIDELITEQQRLIDLLKEKRQAVISHAVTEGLNPDAPMKETAIEWLGEVPEHWDRIQLGKVCQKVADGPHFSPNYVDNGIPFLSARNVKVDSWSLEDVKYISEDDYQEFSRRVLPEKGDVLYTKGGTTGIARVVDIEGLFQVWVHIAVLKIVHEIANSHYIAHSLNSVSCFEQSQLLTQGATNHDFGLTRMIKIWLCLPPLHEQQEIVTFLDRETAKLDELVAELNTRSPSSKNAALP